MRLTTGRAREFVRGISLSLIGNNYKTQIAAEHPNTFYIVKYMQRTGNAEVTGSNPVKALIFFFFRLLLSNCLNWKIYCDDHSSLSLSIL